jgi:hypothetical protein
MLDTVSLTGALSSRKMRLHSRGMMLVLSHLIEDAAAEVEDTILIATFQRFSFMLPQIERYQRFAPRLAHTYVVGLPDVQLPSIPNVTYLPFNSTSPLIHEWVVIGIGPQCCVGLFARDREISQPARRSRTFEGQWTTNQDIIESSYKTLFRALGDNPPPIHRDELATLAHNKGLQQRIGTRLHAHTRHL